MANPTASPVNAKAPDQGNLHRTLRWQEHMVSQAQALSCRVTPEAFRRRIVADRPWQRLVPSTHFTGTPMLPHMEIAPLLYTGQGCVITRLAGLRRHGIRVLAAAMVTEAVL